MIMWRLFPIYVALLATVALPAAAQADFGFEPGSVQVSIEGEEGSAGRQASSHPASLTVAFKLNTTPEGRTEGGQARRIVVDLPPGLIGNPRAVPPCPRENFEGLFSFCPPNTQVGLIHAAIPGIQEVPVPVNNLSAPPGTAAQFGYTADKENIFESATIDPEQGYGVAVAVDIPVETTAATETIWGVPADPSHEFERITGAEEIGANPIPTEAPLLPFLTLPATCGSLPEVTVVAESIFGATVSETVSLEPLSGCSSVPFAPRVAATTSTAAAESSSGLGFELTLPNNGLLAPKAIAETEPEKTEVALPQGVTVNPSAANGIVGCTEAQYNEANGEPGVGCPEASKVGTLLAKTPLLEEAIEGSVYLASPNNNPFNSLLALYIVAKVKERGVLIKQAGLVQAEPTTGQLTATFDLLPPLPYSSFEFRLREGPRAPLITPQACGTYESVAKLYPFSVPGSPVERKTPFRISSGANGLGCAASEAQLPNKPTLEAGTVAPVAGAYSPFVFRVKREDGGQRFSSVQATLPVGLLGKLAGVPYCPEAGVATAASRTQEGGGALENASPSCPPASQVGIVNVAAGAGSQPYVVQGKVYLAGPYMGAPLSLEIITPAIAGPFDLGSVAVRTAVNVDPFTAQINAASDPLPTFMHGIPLDVRSISLQMNKPDFTLNPTNCHAKTVIGSISSLVGQKASLSNPFAVGGCAGLEFKPKLQLTLKGATKRAGHPALKAVLTYPKGSGYANIARAQVGLPHSEFLDQGNIGTVCTQAELRSATCPKASIYGKATAYTPLLGKPLTGPVYLGVGFGHKLPDLVADLNGQIRILVHGKVDTDKQKGIRNTFEAIPDAPVSKFVLELKGGKKGLLENSTNICKGNHEAEAKFNGQNGKVASFKTPLLAGCGRKESKRGKK